MRTPDLNANPLVEFARRIQRLERQAALGFSSITRGSLRVASLEGLIVEGSERVTGILIVDGTLQVAGTQTVSGTLVVTGGEVITGTFTVNGPTTFNGNLTIAGATVITGTFQINGATTINGVTVVNGDMDINGTLDLSGTLNVTGGGKIQAGAVVIDGTSGGRVAAPGATLALVGGQITMTGPVTANNGILVNGPFVALDSKSFGTKHPTKPGLMLLHGATESPVSGIEYWGDATLDDAGKATVELPEYFDALAKPDGRTVFVTGRGFPPDWSDIDTNTFTVTGKPGGRFSWLVKAERFGGDFELEQPMPELSTPLEA